MTPSDSPDQGEKNILAPLHNLSSAVQLLRKCINILFDQNLSKTKQKTDTIKSATLPLASCPGFLY